MSATYRYKNHHGLIDAFAAFKRSTGLPHVLVMAGAEEAISMRELQAHAVRVGVGGDVVCPGRLQHVAAAYQAAEAFVFPSLYETFGLPAIEAMSAGCPLVTSNLGALADAAYIKTVREEFHTLAERAQNAAVEAERLLRVR